MPNHPAPIGAILAGGAARRMGRDKALVPWGTRTLLEHVAAALDKAGCEVIVVGRDGPALGRHAVPDRAGPHRGPANGLLTVFEHAPGRNVMLVAVDQPLLRPATVRGLATIDGDGAEPATRALPSTHPAPCVTMSAMRTNRPVDVRSQLFAAP